MKNRLPMVVLALGAAIVALMWSRHESPVAARTTAGTSAGMEELPQVAADPTPSETSDTTPDVNAATAPDATGAVPAKPKRPALAAAAQPPSGPELEPGLTPVTVLENMRTVFRQYGSRFGGNPVGDNREITAALNGGNPKQVVFVNPEDGLRINERGELIDNWGTPFFFHQLSRTEMEIHSAGPDRKMWTRDDLVIK